jgi:hypothetical protein
MKMAKRRRRDRIFAGATLFIVGAVALAAVTMPRWFFLAMDPGSFEPSKTPPSPDYLMDSSWAALPNVKDDSDVFLDELPALAPEQTQADVFFLHPTTALGKQWNASTNDPVVNKATARGATLIQASAFNACCAVYAPRYRQANGKAFVTPTTDGNLALDVAFADVSAAFDEFLRRRQKSRPFILAFHSQGTVLAERLLTQKIWGTPTADSFVAGYLIGGPISRDSLGSKIPVCEAEDQWGCIVAFNVRGPKYRENEFDFKRRDRLGRIEPFDARICVNPLSWKKDDVRAAAEQHAGAVFFDSETPAILPKFVDATCSDGRLVVQNMGQIPKRDAASGILLWVMGPDQYHPIEYQLFYVNLRKNAVRRVNAYLDAHKNTP